MVINEKSVLEKFEKANKILLIEPDYPTQYPPFALAKIKTYLENKGKIVKFARSITSEKFDLICITTLFTYYSSYVFSVLHNRGFFNIDTPIIVGGVFASLMPKQFDKFPNVDVFKGYSKVLDVQYPDETIMEPTGERWVNYSYVFTSRGCPNRCKYCTVWRIEKDRWINPKWKETVDPKSKVLLLMDNNLSSVTMDHLDDVINFTKERKLKVQFEGGLDCKFVTKEIAQKISTMKFVRHGIRTAFDRIEEDGTFQKAIKMMTDAGISTEHMMSYVLFNFDDKPHDADYRANECTKLKVRAYPSCYRPLNSLHKKSNFVSKYWTLRLTKAFRTFWIMKGIKHGFKDMTFGDYIQTKEGRDKYRLTDNDLDVWNSNGG